MPLLIIRQDITKMQCDAIVNATDRHITCDYGVAKAILEAAGEELNEWIGGFIEVGEVLVSPGFKLPCKSIIHVAGPVWRGGNLLEPERLALCYKNVLKAAVEIEARSVAIPLISSGARGFPKDLVLQIAVDTISKFLSDNEIDVYLVVYDKNSFSIGKKLFGDVTNYINDNLVDTESEDYLDFLYARQQRYAPTDPLIERFDKERNCSKRDASATSAERHVARKSAIAPQSSDYFSDITNMLKHADDTFAVTLLKLIEAKQMDDVECYKRANVSKQTWYKIMNERDYKPSKATVIAFAIALRLNLDETKHLLETVGFALSKSSKFDLIIEYFISIGEYNIFVINDVLFKFDQVLLGVLK